MNSIFDNSILPATLEDNIDLSKLDSSNIPDDNKSQLDTEDFFDTLERQVNGSVYDNADETDDNKSKVVAKDIESEEDTNPTPDEDEGIDWQTRYQDSSNEAKKINLELKKQKEYNSKYSPVIDAMRDDPNIVQLVYDYVQSGDKSQATTAGMNLPEDFIFDMEEALKDPNSDSGRVLDKVVDRKVQSKIDTRVAEERQVSTLENQKANLRSRGVPEAEISEALDWAEDYHITLEDVLILKNRKLRDSKISKQKASEAAAQSKKVKATPKSLAATGGDAGDNKDPDKELFGKILEQVGGQDYFAQ